MFEFITDMFKSDDDILNENISKLPNQSVKNDVETLKKAGISSAVINNNFIAPNKKDNLIANPIKQGELSVVSSKLMPTISSYYDSAFIRSSYIDSDSLSKSLSSAANLIKAAEKAKTGISSPNPEVQKKSKEIIEWSYNELVNSNGSILPDFSGENGSDNILRLYAANPNISISNNDYIGTHFIGLTNLAESEVFKDVIGNKALDLFMESRLPENKSAKQNYKDISQNAFASQSIAQNAIDYNSPNHSKEEFKKNVALIALQNAFPKYGPYTEDEKGFYNIDTQGSVSDYLQNESEGSLGPNALGPQPTNISANVKTGRESVNEIQANKTPQGVKYSSSGSSYYNGNASDAYKQKYSTYYQPKVSNPYSNSEVLQYLQSNTKYLPKEVMIEAITMSDHLSRENTKTLLDSIIQREKDAANAISAVYNDRGFNVDEKTYSSYMKSAFTEDYSKNINAFKKDLEAELDTEIYGRSNEFDQLAPYHTSWGDKISTVRKAVEQKQNIKKTLGQENIEKVKEMITNAKKEGKSFELMIRDSDGNMYDALADGVSMAEANKLLKRGSALSVREYNNQVKKMIEDGTYTGKSKSWEDAYANDIINPLKEMETKRLENAQKKRDAFKNREINENNSPLLN